MGAIAGVHPIDGGMRAAPAATAPLAEALCGLLAHRGPAGRAGRFDHSARLWLLLSHELWAQRFVDERPQVALPAPAAVLAA